MSFGFRVGDFIAAINLANKFRKEFKDAPRQFQAISNEIRSLAIVLQDAVVAFPEHGLNADQQKDLEDIEKGCRDVLNELQRMVDINSELSSESGRSGKRLSRVWKRLKWTPEDVSELRSRIQTNIGLLSAFNERFDRDNIVKLVKSQEKRDHQVILDWITPIDYAVQQRMFIAQRQEGTGQWFLDSAEYRSWLETDKQTLFCPGIPGAGKTVLTSIVVEAVNTQFQDVENIGVAYLYCNFKQHDEQKADNLLASLLKQLVERQSYLTGVVKDLYDRHKRQKTRPSLNEISTTLHEVVGMYSRVFIIVDALDECQVSEGNRQRFLSEVFSLQTQCAVNLFATSRFVPEITKLFQSSISLEIRASEHDVRKYLDSNTSYLSGFQMSPQLEETIINEIIKVVDGMFLLAFLHLKSLNGKRSPKAVRTALKQLPSGSNAYDSAYENAMIRIEGQLPDQVELAKQVLYWITHAKRALNILELRYALAVELNSLDLDEENLSQLEDMINVCAGLVTVEGESNTIRLVHYTTQEYLERKHSQWFPDAQTDIAKICTTYLRFRVFEEEACQTQEEYVERLRVNHFFDYAANYWGYHTSNAPTSTELNTLVLQLLEDEAKVASASQPIMRFRKHPIFYPEFPMAARGLHLTAYFGMQNALLELLKRGHDLDATDSNGQTPLMWAVDHRHTTLVELLLSRGSDVSVMDCLRKTALHHAVSIDEATSIKLLVEYHANLEARDWEGRTPLLLAIYCGQMSAVEMLLRAGADITAFDNERKGALHVAIASEFSGVEMAKLLLDYGAPMDTIDITNMTPLHCTVPYHREDIAILLLQNGVAVDSMIQRKIWVHTPGEGSDSYQLSPKYQAPDTCTSNSRGLTPLHFAALTGDAKMTKFLLRQGANPNAITQFQETPLHLALKKIIQGTNYSDSWNDSRWRLEILRDFVDFEDEETTTTESVITATRNAVVEAFLSDKRTNFTSQDSQGASLLHNIDYTKPESYDTAMKLIQKGAKHSAQNLKGQTVLHLAISSGCHEIVQLYLDNGASVHVSDRDGRTAIHYAAASGNLNILRTIFEQSKGDHYDVLNHKDRHGRTALHHSAKHTSSSKVDMMDLLLRLGADANVRDDFGNSPLAHYLEQHSFSTDVGACQLLFEHKTAATSVNSAGETLAELYVKSVVYSKVNVDILKLFEAYSVDMSRIDSMGRTLLHNIALQGSLVEDVLTFLIDHLHIHLDAVDNSGKTALQYALEKAAQKRDPRTFDKGRWSRTAEILRVRSNSDKN